MYLVLRTLHLPWTVRFILGRWSMIWLFALLCAAGVRHLKSGKPLVTLLAITPGIIFLGSNYGYDTWITGWYFYGLCVLFGELQRPKEILQKKNMGKLLVALFLADLTKLVYFPINAIAFFMPKSKFANKKNYWLYKGAVVLQIVVLLGLLYLRSFAGGVGTGDPRGGEMVNSALQIELAVSEPAWFMHVIFRALLEFINPYISSRGWSNALGYMGRLPVKSLVLILLLIAVVFSWSRREEGKFPWWYRLGVFAVYVSTSAIILVSMYVSYTPVGADAVNGVQHRYLVPLMFPLLFVLTRVSCGKILSNHKLQCAVQGILLAVMMALNVYAVGSLCLAYY